jgi:hypothetical protein
MNGELEEIPIVVRHVVDSMILGAHFNGIAEVNSGKLQECHVPGLAAFNFQFLLWNRSTITFGIELKNRPTR